ncbi:MAG: beta-ketoacyl-ACP synthase III [Bacillota bacterium]
MVLRLRRAGIAALGVALGSKVLTNYDLEKMVDTTDEWILTRTGIRERRIAADEDATSDLAVRASRRALRNGGLDPSDIDMIICATVTPDMLFPSTASLVQRELGARRAVAFDIEAACSGFIFGLSVASQYIATNTCNNVLVIGAECLSRITNWSDRSTCILFGDGAGAAVLRPARSEMGIIKTALGSDGWGADLLKLPAGGSRLPASRTTVRDGLHYIHMNGNRVFEFAVKAMGEAALAALDGTGYTPGDIDLFVPHQANLRIIESARRRLGIEESRVMVNVERYGNMSSASVPVALSEALEQGRLAEGDMVMLVAFGAGLSWGAALIRWGI